MDQDRRSMIKGVGLGARATLLAAGAPSPGATGGARHAQQPASAEGIDITNIVRQVAWA